MHEQIVKSFSYNVWKGLIKSFNIIIINLCKPNIQSQIDDDRNIIIIIILHKIMRFALDREVEYW